MAPDGFWNAAHFNGAVVPLSSLTAAADPAQMAWQFFRTGRALLLAR
ncbi:MAG: hypothetical protein ACXV5U_06480 [Ilumatobacteraceae bacterium]